jgi:hypothetical protein
MSRSRHQHHRVRGKGKYPRIDRNRKHKPYGLHKNKYSYEVFKKLGWDPDTNERSAMGDIQNKAKAHREGKKEIEEQLQQ